MAEQKETSPRYKVKLIPTRGEEFDDVIFCVCVKAPFIKKASFWNLKINVSSLWAQFLINDLSKNIKVPMTLKITEVRYEGQANSLKGLKDITTIHEKSLICIHATNAKGGYKINIQDKNTTINLVLVDHILYDMSVKNMFNRRLKDVTAFEALQEYEKDLKKIYGEKTFYNNYIGIEDESKSDYKYEHILFTSINDLHISDILLYSKKILKHLSFYFFDDFYLDKQNSNHITNHFINLNDITKFTKFDITKNYDTLYNNTILKEVPFNDNFKTITQGFDSVIFKTKYMFDKLIPEDINTLFKPKTSNIVESDYDINDSRKSKINKPEIDYEKSTERQKCMQIYVPDKKDLAKERLKNYRDFVDTKVKNLIIVQTADCYCDWLQFGRSYNLNINNRDEYIFTPIIIGNIFYKDGAEEATKHMSKSLMLEYYQSSETCSSCKYYSEKTCTIHHTIRDENSSCFNHTTE